MKILLIHNAYRQRGGEDVVVEQERALLEAAGHRVVAYQRSNWELEVPSGLGRVDLLKQIVWSTDAKQGVSRLLAEQKPDIVHVHNTFLTISPSIYWACEDAAVPVVQTLHNYRLLCPAACLYRDGKVCEECSEHGLWRGIRHGCYRDSRSATAAVALTLGVHRQLGTWNRGITTYIALSEFARKRFIAGGLPAEKITVKPNFVHPRPGARTEIGQYAMFAGRLSAEKGVSTLLKGWAGSGAAMPLRIIGDGPLRASLEQEAAALGLSDVHFDGLLSREQTLEALKKARFLLCPSQSYENFPMIIVEAFACSTPVICSRLGAMEEIVRDGHTGLHFVTGDVDDMATKIAWAAEHPERMQCMGNQARQEYETRYTAEKNYAVLMDIYERARHGSSRQRASAGSQK